MPKLELLQLSELPESMIRLAESDPEEFKNRTRKLGIKVIPDAGTTTDAMTRKITGRTVPGRPIGLAAPGASKILNDDTEYGLIDNVPPPKMEGQTRMGMGMSIPTTGAKFAQGAVPGFVRGGYPGAIMGGIMNAGWGPDPESPRALANAGASLTLGPILDRIRGAMPDPVGVVGKLGRAGYDVLSGAGETYATDKAGDAMSGKQGNGTMVEALVASALGKTALGALSGTARAAASRMPESLRRKLGSVAQQLAGGVDEQAQQAEQKQIAMLEQKAAEGDATAKLFLAKLRGGAQPTQPVNLAGNADLAQPPNPLTAKPVQPPMQQPAPNPLMAEPQPPPQNPLMQPPMVNKQPSTADIQAKAFEDQFANGRQSPVANDDLTAKLQATLALLQKGVPASQIKADVPAVAKKPQFRVRSQADLMDYIKSKGYTDAEASAYLEKRRADAIGEGGWWGRNGVAKDQLDLEFPTRQNPEKGAITIPGDDIKAARKAISEGIDTTRNAIGSAVTGTRNAMGEFFGGGAPPRTANVDPVLAQGSYRDYANSIGKEFGDAVKDPKKAWAPTELDSLIEGKDVTQLPVALQGGSPEFKQAVRTRMTEKLLGAFDGFQKAGDEELSVFDKFHEMRKADLGGGVTGGSVLRATFGNDAVQNIEHLYEALEKSKNLPSQQEKHPFMNIQSLGNALRISIPSAGIGAFFSAHGGVLPATAAAAGAGTVINLGFDKLGQMLGKTNSKFFQFLVDAVEGGSRFTPAMAAQYIAGLKQAADSVTDENGNPIQ